MVGIQHLDRFAEEPSGYSALMRTAVAELTVLVMLAAGCSSGNVARVSDACDLLTSSEVADNIHADADPGVLMSASNETETRICSFKVGGQLGAVLVYLGAGVAPANTDRYRATEVRGDTYVIVWAQNVVKEFPEQASRLAQLAIHRACRE